MSAETRRRNSLRLLCYSRANRAFARGAMRLGMDWIDFAEALRHISPPRFAERQAHVMNTGTFIGCYPNQLGILSDSMRTLDEAKAEVSSLESGQRVLTLTGTDPDTGRGVWIRRSVMGDDIELAALEIDIELSQALGFEE